MIKKFSQANEDARLAKLKSYKVLDTLPEKIYDDITHIASEICNTPISLISLVDADRQWFKSRKGLKAQEIPRSIAFCSHAIKENELLYVPDTSIDYRFKQNPFVTGPENIAFYAGAPITTPEGFKMGALCVIDNQPRSLNESQKNILARLANQIASHLELRLNVANLKKVNEELRQFAYRTSHDLKSPISSSTRLAEYIQEDIGNGNLEEAQLNATKIKALMSDFSILIKDILSTVKADVQIYDRELLNISLVIDSIKQRLANEINEFDCKIITTIDSSLSIFIEKKPFTQIIENLISNGIKYSNSSKDNSFVKIHIFKSKSNMIIRVEDNGIGIPKKFQTNIYKMFTRFHPEKSFGSGLGLSIVKKHVVNLSGNIEFSSTKNGTTFEITLPIDNNEGTNEKNICTNH